MVSHHRKRHLTGCFPGITGHEQHGLHRGRLSTKLLPADTDPELLLSLRLKTTEPRCGLSINGAYLKPSLVILQYKKR